MFNRKEPVKLELNYRGFDRIEGSDFLISPLSSQERGFKGNIHFTAHNYLFLKLQDFSTHWLFPSNEQVISSFYQIPSETSSKIKESFYHENYSPIHEDNFSAQDKSVTGWLIFKITKAESNQKKSIIGLSDVSGKKIVEIIKDVDFIDDIVRISKDILILMYRSNNKFFVSEIQLSEFKVNKSKELPKI